MTMTTDRLDTLSTIAAGLREPTSAVVRVAHTLALKPALRLNGTAFYSAEQAERIREYLSRRTVADG